MPCPYALTLARCQPPSNCTTINSVNACPPYSSPLHSRRSVRLPGYDYARPGAYFITICAARRRFLFGEIDGEDRSLRPSPIGELVIECWESIPTHFPGVTLDEFVLMPNHLHGILLIASSGESEIDTSQRKATPEAFGKPVRRSIPTIVRSFKSAVSRRGAEERHGSVQPVWQRNYYESIIRTDHDLDDVRKYISDNPAKWSEDPENPVLITQS